MAIVAVAATALAFQVSIAGVFSQSRPEIALRFAPYHAWARSKLATDLVAFDPPDEIVEAARAIALDAIRRDPLQPQALRALAESIVAEGSSDPRVLPLLMQSARLSNRDHGTQLRLIDYHLRRGNLDEMMRRFDIALRVSGNGRQNLYSLLSTAASEPAFRARLVRTLEAKPSWSKPFAIYVVQTNDDLDFAARLARMFLEPDESDDLQVYGTLLDRSTNARRFELAWSVDQGLGSGSSSRAQLRNGDFETAPGLPPFEWSFAEEPDIWAYREQIGDNTVLRVGAGEGRSGTVARQLLHLPAGQYGVRARMGDLPDDPAERPEVAIECATSDGAGSAFLLRSTARAKAESPQGRLNVPATCAFQWLSVRIAGDGPESETSPWVDDLRIAPAGS